MIKFGKAVVKSRVIILIVAVLLLIPAVIGMVKTRVNYDMLDYLPDDMETVQGQNILLDEFGKGGFSMFLVQGMSDKDVSKLKAKIEGIDHVDSVVWYDSLLDLSVPKEFLPDKFYEIFNNKDTDTTMMLIFFDTSVSSDETITAISDIRDIADKQCFVSGMSAFVTDLKNIAETEEPLYVAIAVILTSIILAIFMDSYILPVIFMISIGIAILYNLGSNYFFGEISYITKALSAVLQLAVTMDYSIFLWHSYEEQKIRYDGDKERAMSHAISGTITSVAGSSLTTIAGFLALCFMNFTLGKDLGIVMAKGVVFGVIICVTVLPSLILIFDGLITKTSHKPLMPSMVKPAKLITKYSYVFLILFLLILVPAAYGYFNTEVYYKLDEGVPQDLDCIVANKKLQNDFDMNSTHMLIVKSDLSAKDAKAMLDKIDKVDGVNYSLGINTILGASVPEEFITKDIIKLLKSKDYQMMLVISKYQVASNEVNNQITQINNIVKEYDANGMVIGEAPCTKDLITTTDRDFKVVDILSIAAIFIIIFFVLKSISLPVILVSVIEFAIFINLGLPYYTNSILAFIAPICISTIQLGATVDYAILMSTRYKRERNHGANKKDSIVNALAFAMPSIIVSGLGFFAATFGVGLYSDIDLIGSLCSLMARGAIVSMLSVILVLPAMFMVFDKIICKTSLGFKADNSITN